MPSIRYGMVGGGPDSFIGGVHRKAAALDGELQLTAGAFSSDPQLAHRRGREIGLSSKRVYGSFREMAETEAALPDEQRIHAVTIVTPNHLHAEIARVFIEVGIHVICDKPMTTTVEDAETLCRLVREKNVVFALTHNYAGYPMVKQAREMVRQGRLGKVRKVVVEYPQGWLTTLLEKEGQKQASWRADPKQSGGSLAVGDIGSHAEHLVRYVTGLEISSLLADLAAVVPGRTLEDDANMLIHYHGGARGVLYASQISVGEENNLTLRVYGSEASLAWRQEDPNYLTVGYADRPREVLARGNSYLEPIAQHNTRLPPGHPEGFIEAFANIYRNAARTILARIEHATPGEFDKDFPTVQDGAIGVHFIHKALESGRTRSWVDAAYTAPPNEASS